MAIRDVQLPNLGLKDEYDFFSSDTSGRVNEVQQTDADKFSRLLGNVFTEGKRVLKTNGKMAFSFHHSRTDGWLAIAKAIKQAEFFVTDVFPIHAELMASTPKASAKEPISIDAIITCAKSGRTISEEDVITESIGYIDDLKKSKKNAFQIGCICHNSITKFKEVCKRTFV